MPDQIDEFLDAPSSSPVPDLSGKQDPLLSGAATLLPQSAAAVSQPITFGSQAQRVESQLPPVSPQPAAPLPIGRPTPKRAEEAFKQAEQEGAVPLDTQEGAGVWDRLMLEMRRNRENQISYLEKKYGPNKVRMTKEGELIVRVPDPENKGKEKDILAIPHGKLTASDFINLSAAFPEIGGWIAGEKLISKIPGMTEQLGARTIPRRGLLGAAGRLAGGAIGAETAGAVTKDIPADIYDRGTIDLGEIAKARGTQAVADVGVGAFLGGLGSAFRFLKAPLHGQRGQLELDALGAKQYFKDKYGVDVPMSIGESTGAPLFARSEAFVEKEPGGSGPIRAVKAKQEGMLRRLQSLMMGSASPLDEEVGQRAIDEIQSKIGPVVQGEEARRQALAGSAQSSLEGIVSGLTSPDRQLYKSKLGSEIRQGVVAKRDEMKAEADRLYQAVRDLPGGTGRVFDGSDLQKKFDDILKNLPGMDVSRPSAILGPTGKPIPTTATETLEKWPPDKLLGRLREITSAKDPKFALSDLQQMRRDIYDDIQKGEGVPGLGTRYLSQIGTAITDFMNESIAKLPDGDPLKVALKTADKHYKEKVVPFNRMGLTELFRAADEPGYIADDQVLNRVLGGSDSYRNWNLMKETLGQTSPTFQKMKRAVADNLIEPARLPGDQTIDAKKFVQNLYEFQRNNREIYDEVFSQKERELFRQARLLQYAQGDKIDAAELNKLLASPDPNAPRLKALIDAENKKTSLYRNSLLKSIGDGTVDEATLRPTEFVNRLLSDKGFGLDDTKQLMALLHGNPQLEQELKQKAFERIFREAARPAKAEDITRTAAGDNTHILSGVLLNQALKDKTYKSKIAEILGKDAFDDLQNYIKLTAPLEKKEEAYALAGGLAAGSRIGQLEKVMEGRGGLLRFANNTARSFVFSWMLSNPAVRDWLSRVPSGSSDAKGLMMTVLSSPPFIQAVAKQFPGATGARFINELRSSIQQAVSKEPQQDLGLPDTGVRKMSIDQFLNQ